jgi:hypothetical protein
MGLHESLLDVPERLRVWQQAGVRYFYLSGRQADPSEQQSSPLPNNASDPASWPDPWPVLFAKAPKRPRLVITYYELGFDLTGQADSHRRALWRDLIADLGLSGQNTVAFWPMALPNAETLSPRLDIFQAGLTLLSPGLLAVFGEKAAALFRDLPQEFSALSCVLLPEPHLLRRDDTEAWNHVLARLGNV